MQLSTFLIISGVLLMAKPNESISVEPGKQLPQSTTVSANESGKSRDVTIRYMLFVPKDYKSDGKPWPLMLFLHGLGECSNDDLSRVKIHGPAKIVESRPDFPFVVVTPQCPLPKGYEPGKPVPPDLMEIIEHAWKPDELIQLIDHISDHLNIDRERIYVTGLSMGGYGTWRLAASHPDRFAAAAPICGGGEPEKMAAGLAKVPIWAFHGAKDTVVPIKESQEMADAVKRAGGDVKLTVYPDAEHNSWAQTYDNPAVYEWLLSHRHRTQ